GRAPAALPGLRAPATTCDQTASETLNLRATAARRPRPDRRYEDRDNRDPASGRQRPGWYWCQSVYRYHPEWRRNSRAAVALRVTSSGAVPTPVPLGS